MPHSSYARACGIDFGTSSSMVGWLRPGQATLPSVAFFNTEENSVSFGRAGLCEYFDGYI